jgi:hypothetical protein
VFYAIWRQKDRKSVNCVRINPPNYFGRKCARYFWNKILRVLRLIAVWTSFPVFTVSKMLSSYWSNKGLFGRGLVGRVIKAVTCMPIGVSWNRLTGVTVRLIQQELLCRNGVNVTVPHPVPTWTEFLTLVTRQDPSQMVSISSEEFLWFYNSYTLRTGKCVKSIN